MENSCVRCDRHRARGQRLWREKFAIATASLLATLGLAGYLVWNPGKPFDVRVMVGGLFLGLAAGRYFTSLHGQRRLVFYRQHGDHHLHEYAAYGYNLANIEAGVVLWSMGGPVEVIYPRLDNPPVVHCLASGLVEIGGGDGVTVMTRAELLTKLVTLKMRDRAKEL